MNETTKFLFIGAGAVIAVIAVLDILSVPVELPTSNSWVNLGIGGLLIGVPYIMKVA